MGNPTEILERQAAPLSRVAGTWAGSPAFQQAIQALERTGEVTWDGVWGSLRAFWVAALREALPQHDLLVLLPQADLLDHFLDDLALMTAAPVLPFPATTARQVLTDDAWADRLNTLRALGPAHPPAIIVTSPEALIQPVSSPEAFRRQQRVVRVGQELPPEELARWLTAEGFTHTTGVAFPGEYSWRGGILDVFPPEASQPFRIEWFGDEVESIRRFDVQTQRSLDRVESLEILGTLSLPQDRLLLDYLSRQSVSIWVEPIGLEETAERFAGSARTGVKCVSWQHVAASMARLARAFLWELSPGTGEREWRVPGESVERFRGGPEAIRRALEALDPDETVWMAAETPAEQERLRELFADTPPGKGGRLRWLIGRLSAGFRLPDLKQTVLTALELFGRTAPRRVRRRHFGRPIDSFHDLKPGDLVVHLAHGIGRYRGLEIQETGSGKQEFLRIEFAEGTMVCVPVTRMDLVHKYVGGSRARPALARLGGTSWVRQKKAAQSAVLDLAAEMLELDARRRSLPGIAFGPDTQWQREFDAAFPFTETPDQLAAIQAIKADMESPRPMDRLLCGDVGFGKTELAMRAAFKAVDCGYQVAVLVPTTVLAEQHYRTFRERMAEFPIDVARLSRFCTPAQEREILEGLARGRIDIVIGTHRLASSDIQFRNLGLVIIDEEQRFGVRVKERMKKLRPSVDVLTLSATPIPRTLHMALVGVRDISNLETPPEDRLSVETRVMRFQPEVIQEGIRRELARQGQVYFVHNRVETIGQMQQQLQALVPEARIGIAHGQMAERELEQVMVDFLQRRYDVLLATTIIENGLDIPSVNTIFINDADRFGLADLHQLRGRVGRYKHQAYCYLLLRRGKNLTPNAARRLRAIEEYSHMGAGFAIAMRDLEIRGAGNLLGTQQSGHIAAVGYQLYCQLLENAVRQLQNLPPRHDLEVDVQMPGEARLPEAYIPDMRQKIDLYRRLCAVATHQDVEELAQEMRDRFGPLPPAAQNLLALTHLKVDAARWGLRSLTHTGDRVVASYVDPRRIRQLAARSPGRVRVVDAQTAHILCAAPASDPARLIGELRSLLQRPEEGSYNSPGLAGPARSAGKGPAGRKG